MGKVWEGGIPQIGLRRKVRVRIDWIAHKKTAEFSAAFK